MSGAKTAADRIEITAESFYRKAVFFNPLVEGDEIGWLEGHPLDIGGDRVNPEMLGRRSKSASKKGAGFHALF